jgi:hypothetical protein
MERAEDELVSVCLQGYNSIVSTLELLGVAADALRLPSLDRCNVSEKQQPTGGISVNAEVHNDP